MAHLLLPRELRADQSRFLAALVPGPPPRQRRDRGRRHKVDGGGHGWLSPADRAKQGSVVAARGARRQRRGGLSTPVDWDLYSNVAMSARALATASPRSRCSLGRPITYHRPSSLRQVCKANPRDVLITSTQYSPSPEWMLSMTFSVGSPSIANSILDSITRLFKFYCCLRKERLPPGQRRSAVVTKTRLGGPGAGYRARWEW